MSQVTFIAPVDEMTGKFGEKTILRKKKFRAPNGKVLFEGPTESYPITNPRNYKKNPPKGAELANINLFGNISHLAAEIIRSSSYTEEELAALIKESQTEKTRLKRIKNAWKDYIDYQKKQFNPWLDRIKELREERKQRSAALQQWIFEQFRMLNARGEEKNIYDIFFELFEQLPPAGTGECAAPKLLQYAYQNGLEPIAMAEFWWGDSPKGEIRRHGQYYPSCKHKCEPILGFMLQGLDVEPNPLLITNTDASQLETIYEDEYLLVVNKPSGMLSVPGKTDQVSVASIMAEKYPDVRIRLIHREQSIDEFVSLP